MTFELGKFKGIFASGLSFKHHQLSRFGNFGHHKQILPSFSPFTITFDCMLRTIIDPYIYIYNGGQFILLAFYSSDLLFPAIGNPIIFGSLTS